MKTPADYIAAVLPPKGEGSQTLLFAADAERAVAAALADAERYKNNLLRALRHAKLSTPQADAATLPHD